MRKNIELRDDTYYDDLIYEVKRLAGFDVPVDFDIWASIARRKDNVRVDEFINGELISGYCMSAFQEDLFYITRNIGQKVNNLYISDDDLKKYPILVKFELADLEKRKIENELLKHLCSMIEEMGLTQAFSLGEDAEQCVCLNKNKGIWEVYMVERGIAFEKDFFEDCFDACLKVIHHLADSKQMWEENRDKFVKVRKLTPKK